MVFLLRSLLCLLTLLLVNTSYAEISKAQAQLLLEKSGSLAVIEETPYVVPLAMIQSSLVNGHSVSLATKAALQKKSISLFNQKKITEKILEAWMEKFNQKEFKILVDWFDSDLGKKLVAKEVFYQSRTGINMIGKELLSKKVSAVKQDLSRKISAETYDDQYVQLVIEAMVDGMILGLHHQYKKTLTAEEIHEIKQVMQKSMIPEALPKLRSEIALESTIVYADFTVDELELYLNKLRSPAFKRYYEISLKSTAPLINEYISRIMEERMKYTELDPE